MYNKYEPKWLKKSKAKQQSKLPNLKAIQIDPKKPEVIVADVDFLESIYVSPKEDSFMLSVLHSLMRHYETPAEKEAREAKERIEYRKKAIDEILKDLE